MKNATVTLHMVSSLDGFIAKRNDDVSWLHSRDSYDKGVVLTDEYIANFITSIDCYVMGAYTYEHALKLGWPYGDKPVIVLSSRALKSDKTNVSFFSGDLVEIVNKQLINQYRNIWLVGGSKTAKSFLQANLVNEIVISIMPVILGDGLLFFDFIGKEYPLHLKEVMPFKDGMVELTYQIIKGE